MRKKLQPVLASFDACDHVRQLRANDRLGVERFPEDDALVRPLQALFDDLSLSTETRAHDHPSLVVEVAQDDVHALSDLAERV